MSNSSLVWRYIYIYKTSQAQSQVKTQLLSNLSSNIIICVGGKDLNFYVGSQAPITNKNTSKEEETFGNAP